MKCRTTNYILVQYYILGSEIITNNPHWHHHHLLQKFYTNQLILISFDSTTLYVWIRYSSFGAFCDLHTTHTNYKCKLQSSGIQFESVQRLIFPNYQVNALLCVCSQQVFPAAENNLCNTYKWNRYILIELLGRRRSIKFLVWFYIVLSCTKMIRRQHLCSCPFTQGSAASIRGKCN